jgi:hypothetical protein
MRVWGDGITGSVSNMDVHNGGYVGSVGINVLEAHSVLLSVNNLRVSDSGAANVFVHRSGVQGGSNPKVLVDNVVANGWDYMNTGWRAFTVDAGSTIVLGFNREFTSSHNNGLYWTAGVVPDM